MKLKISRGFTELTQEEQEIVSGGAEVVNALAGISAFFNNIFTGTANGITSIFQGLAGGLDSLVRGITTGLGNLISGFYYSLMSFYR